MAAIVDRWIVLEHGAIAFSGSRADLTRALAKAPPEGLLRRFFGDPAAFGALAGSAGPS